MDSWFCDHRFACSNVPRLDEKSSVDRICVYGDGDNRPGGFDLQTSFAAHLPAHIVRSSLACHRLLEVAGRSRAGISLAEEADPNPTISPCPKRCPAAIMTFSSTPNPK